MSSKRGLYVAQGLSQDELTALRSMVASAWRRRGIFTTLPEAARKECQRRRLPSLLFIVERQSASGQAFVAALQPQYDHSEYKMAFRSPQPPELPASSPLQFPRAGLADRAILTSITVAAFAMLEEEVDWYSTILKNGPTNIVLEMTVENEHAPGLYISGGFVQLSRYDYYHLPI